MSLLSRGSEHSFKLLVDPSTSPEVPVSSGIVVAVHVLRHFLDFILILYLDT